MITHCGSTRIPGIWLAAGCLYLAGCATTQAPVLPADHPARTEMAGSEIADAPSVLDVTRATRRDPAAVESTMLYPDMPMHEMKSDQHESMHEHH